MKNNTILFLITLILFMSIVSTSQSREVVHSKLASASPQNRYIVELKEQGVYQKLAVLKESDSGQAIQKIRATINSQQEAFKTDVQRQFKSSIPIGHQFKSLLNAIVVTAQPSQVESLSKLTSVKRIHKVIQYKITAVNDVTDYDVINVDLLRTSQLIEDDIDGEGVKVAIVDTGIDYTHPDLGGCLGSGCKVYAGYDFFDGDEDPIDVHSHGTHVAGIVAANGELRGIAPAASLLAIKVCSDEGYCNTTDIIKGLEFALDPDGDSATDDGADVLNLSLGSSSEDKALRDAVNNLVEMGVVVVVSAGNDGPDDDTFSSASENLIGSPADAEKAITVAASDSNKNIAEFSSKGYPSSGAAILKPEVAAPGVSIYSSIPGGGYGYKTGTSMSSPMVAGVVALLKQIAPEKSPEQLKAALVATATSIAGSDPTF
ncbi:S8 family peptidase, partial [Lacimicrobium alkaliphilum]